MFWKLSFKEDTHQIIRVRNSFNYWVRTKLGYLRYLFVICRYERGRLISYINISSFAGAIYRIIFSPVCQLLEFRFWRWITTFLEMEIKEFGRSTWYNTHNTRLLMGTSQACPRHRCRRKKPLRWKNINTNTHKHHVAFALGGL